MKGEQNMTLRPYDKVVVLVEIDHQAFMDNKNLFDQIKEIDGSLYMQGNANVKENTQQ